MGQIKLGRPTLVKIYHFLIGHLFGNCIHDINYNIITNVLFAQKKYLLFEDLPPEMNRGLIHNAFLIPPSKHNALIQRCYNVADVFAPLKQRYSLGNA